MATSTSVDASLWWDPFSLLLTDLENTSLTSTKLPPKLMEKLEENHAWFVETVSLFKKPNEKSRAALNFQQVKIGSHSLSIQSELKDKALKFSSYLCLDEVQSYILVERYIQDDNVASGSLAQELLHMVLLEYYIERQCLLKCTRHILLHALYVGNGSKEGDVCAKALKLVNDGLESKLISVLQCLLSSTHPEQMDVDLFTFWAEETLAEENLILDILFVAYYESFCRCNGERWRILCLLYKGIICGSYNIEMLAISTTAMHSSYQVKVRLLLILMETLDLENLLQAVHDEATFRKGASVFTSSDFQEMDAIVSGLNAFEIKEAGPLVLTWAVYLCLLSSLPGKEEHNVLLEIDHVGYVRQAFDSASFNYFLELLHSDLLKESEGLIVGYRSVLRTFVSAFIASYEINLQVEDTTLCSILDILCNIYRGEESLCTQFWDRESFIDGPIRCLLCDLEGEFPSRIVEFIRLLSSLCEGSWPAECVYNFLDKSVGISSLFEISSRTLMDAIPEIVETQQPLRLLGMEGLLIPSKTRGHVLKVVNRNTVLVRWEYKQSGMLILLMRLAQEMYLNSDEQVLILDLLSRMVSFNPAVCFALMGITNSFNSQLADTAAQMEKNIWVVEVICILIKNLSPNSSNATAMSMGLNFLAKMLKCFPIAVTPVALKANIFDVTGPDALSGSWLQFGKVAKMLLIDFEQNHTDCPLSLSLLDYTMQLVETGLENNVILALVAFCIQYILVNHEYWNYKVKHTRWSVTLKVLEVMRRCILLSSGPRKLGQVVQNMLLSDSSIHNTLFRVVCTTRQALEKLYVSRLSEPREIEGFERAICSALDIIFIMLSKFSKDSSAVPAVFHQALLSLKTKPIPIVAAVISLLSYFRNVRVQVCAARVLSMMLLITDDLHPNLSSVCFSLDDEQITDLRHSIECILLKKSVWDEDLFVAVVNILTSAALHQPSFLVAVLSIKENLNVQLNGTGAVNRQTNECSVTTGLEKSSLIDSFLQYLKEADKHDGSNLRILLNVLNFMKALWQTSGPFIKILDRMKTSEKFLEQLTNTVSQFVSEESCPPKNLTEIQALNSAYKYFSLSSMMEIISYDIFLQTKLSHAELLVKEQTGSKEKVAIAVSNANLKSSASLSDVKNILSAWCESSLLGNLFKLLASCGFDKEIFYRVKVASSLFIVHVMSKLSSGGGGSLSVSLVEKIHDMLKKLISLPAFAELSNQYLNRGYSGGDELKGLILSDLYYHLQGELEGREIGSGAFRELSLFLIESTLFHSYQHTYDDDIFVTAKDAYLFDLMRVQEDLGLDLWDYSDWKESKAIAARMLHCMQDVNLMMLVAKSRLAALKSLITFFAVNADDSFEKETAIAKKSIGHLVTSYMVDICHYLHVTIESLTIGVSVSQYVLGFLTAQLELLSLLMRSAYKNVPLSVCTLILKTSGSALKQFSGIQTVITGANKTIKLLLILVLSSVEFHDFASYSNGASDQEYVKDFAEFSNVIFGLLPVLCSFTTNAEHCTLALTTVDLILRSFFTSETWLPVLQNHLQLQYLFLKLQDEKDFASVPILMKFFLSLARFRGGAEMLINAGFLSSLRVVFTQCWDDRTLSHFDYNRNNLISGDKAENFQQIWELGLAVVTAVVQSLGDGSSYLDIIDNVATYFFSEKADMISYYLNAPDFHPDDHDKKRPRTQRTKTSLSALRNTKQTLMLMCVLARHVNSWVKATKEIDSQLREKCIHILAFVSRGTQCLEESTFRISPLLCPPNCKEEFECCKKPSFIHSKSGWFALSPLACGSEPEFAAASTTSLIISRQTAENSDLVCPTYFSDTLALHMYTITFLLLKFLCLQAEGAASRAEEVGYVDVAHFPELPMPEILHGLQDQAMAIVSELCNVKKSKHIDSEIENFCYLLLQIIEMTLYLEHCVLQICGIRPVLGRVEDFSRELKLLLKSVEGYAFLKGSLKSLKQIISIVYPGLLQGEGL